MSRRGYRKRNASRRRSAPIDRTLTPRHSRTVASHQLGPRTRLLSLIRTHSRDLLHRYLVDRIIRVASGAFSSASARFGLAACLLLSLLAATSILVLHYNSKQPLALDVTGNQDRVIFIVAGQPVTARMFHTAEFQRVQTLLKQGKDATTAREHRQVTDYAFDSIVDNIETEKAMHLQGAASTNDLVSKLFPLRKVSSQDAHRFYETHPSLFARPVGSIHVREIAVSNQQLANDLLTRLHAGVSFSDLAARYSIDPAMYRQAGGDMGWMAEGAMPPDWNFVVYALHKGETSEVFKAGNVFCIVQVVDGPAHDTIPYDAVTPSVSAVAAQYEQQQQFVAWLTERILKEPLEVRDTAFTMVVQTAVADLAAHPSQTFD